MRHRSSASPLAWMVLALIVYASLYPFSGWRAPHDGSFAFLIAAPSRWWTWFDVASNLLGYMPFGALLFGALVRTGHKVSVGLVAAIAASALLSLCMEMLQTFLPQRIPSNIDLALNVAGGALGALVGLSMHMGGVVERWQRVRDRWFITGSAGGIALLLLWPVGLLFPPPIPLGLGQIWGALQDAANSAVQGTPVEAWWAAWTDSYALSSSGPLSPAAEWAATVLGLMAPCLIAFTITPTGWRRVLLVAGAAVLGFAATTLSTALNFSPEHALAWLTPAAGPGWFAGILGASLLAFVRIRFAAGLGLIVLTALVALVAQAPADPYYAESLQAWEQGRFIRFHGVALWVGRAWPYAAAVYLLARIGTRDRG